MEGSTVLSRTAAGWFIGAMLAGAACAADPMPTTDDLLKDPRFKAAYLGALGPKAKERWLARMSNSSLVRKVSIGGAEYRVAAPCKPHDCGDNNLLLLYSPARAVVYGKLFEKGRSTLIGSPDTAMSAELDRMWNQEFRQK
ncbi:MAG TPA: Ivy family c-type lysozyme inhibitor [Caldimonas sp.]|jgi:hypothetical protein|nr:Ivy family c-type lysozyme inhibitor [Caldimonas sp.]HEX2539654.1 Ivy family c-type lysozyme inhibitor [Caldimonas sp.]